MTQSETRRAFDHEAWMYAGTDELVARLVPFVREGVDLDEPVLVAVQAPKIDRLRDALGDAAEAVSFADMAEIGHNPARIIPAWRDFVDAHAEAPRLRGVGEPLYAKRGAAERVECHAHEALLNVALADAPIRLVCPYDVDQLTRADIETAIANHPIAEFDGTRLHNPSARTIDWFASALPEPPRAAPELAYDLASLVAVRRYVDEEARTSGFDAGRRDAMVLATSEVATNSLKHGGGRGVFRCWTEEHAFVCEVRDAGWIREPMVGRIRPQPGQEGGHGLWLANHLADLVQVRSTERGTVVRLHFNR